MKKLTLTLETLNPITGKIMGACTSFDLNSLCRENERCAMETLWLAVQHLCKQLEATPRQRLESLLAIHGGQCAVLVDSELGQAAREMEEEKLVALGKQGASFANEQMQYLVSILPR